MHPAIMPIVCLLGVVAITTGGIIAYKHYRAEAIHADVMSRMPKVHAPSTRMVQEWTPDRKHLVTIYVPH